MNQDRIGAFLLLIASGWMVSLAFTHPGNTASSNYRSVVVIAAVAMLVLIILPRMQYRTVTAYTFSVLGVTLSVGMFGIFGIGFSGLIPAILLMVAIWLRRNRLDGHTGVVIVSVVACSLAIASPPTITFAWIFIAVANATLWGWNLLVRQIPWRRLQAR